MRLMLNDKIRERFHIMNGLLELFNYGDRELTLKQQADLVDHLMDLFYGMLWKTFPDLGLSRSGSVYYNDSSIQVGGDVKALLLSKKDLDEVINKCSGCGRDNPQQIKEWILERMISESKDRLKKEKQIN